MNPWPLHVISADAFWPFFLLALAVGFLAGLGYFYAIWWSARALLSGRHGAALTIFLSISRLALLAGLLILAAHAGAIALLLTALGLLAARFVVIRHVGQESP